MREFVHSSPSSAGLTMSGTAPPSSLYVLVNVQGQRCFLPLSPLT
jgi:hypothetical protein